MNKLFCKFTSLLLLTSFSVTFVIPQTTVQKEFPVKREESPATWERDGWNQIAKSRKIKFKRRKAKNVILFLGDGMSISTLAAARILEGQLRGESGEENLLSFEQFPFSALSRTYSVNQQTSDSAPTMSAIMTGVKTVDGAISVNQNILNGEKTGRQYWQKTMLEMAEETGRSTGVISTARLTHATPAACYAHSPERGWESDADILQSDKEAYEAKYPDIARQLIEFPYGNGLEVALGGGRAYFTPKTMPDAEYPDGKGKRLDGRDLTAEWKAKRKNSEYVWNKAQFDAIDPKKTDHLLGLFQPSHLQYEHDRAKDKAGEPSLSEMTSKAIDILSKNKKGFFLMVEGGRIDHAHHMGNAYRALTEAIELSNAVRTAKNKIDLSETLIIVTADHSHTMTFSGYPSRGNNIMGLVREPGSDGKPQSAPTLDKNKMPYTTLGYANGPGAVAERKVLTDQEVTDPNYLQESLVPKSDETHGGEDVAIFADGVNAWMFRGSMEENWIFYVMADAFRLKK
ncbi:MAG: alkaline phosphatase [Acidobacteria bacterium]|nr:alkaline phosphatase [Acidobacteriota bacterium]